MQPRARGVNGLIAAIGLATVLAATLPGATARAVTRHHAATTATRSATPGAAPQLRHRGPFLVDRTGRVVIIHGINAVYKRAPYVAPATDRGFTARDARFLAASGINAVRLGVLFSGGMPRRGVIDHRYLLIAH